MSKQKHNALGEHLAQVKRGIEESALHNVVRKSLARIEADNKKSLGEHLAQAKQNVEDSAQINRIKSSKAWKEHQEERAEVLATLARREKEERAEVIRKVRKELGAIRKRIEADKHRPGPAEKADKKKRFSVFPFRLSWRTLH